jgi:pyruvate dehydrogenase E1 component beta subunit
MVPIVIEAADCLAAQGYKVEVVDLRTLSPLDIDTVVNSVRKTRRLLVAEMGWIKFGVAAEIIAAVCEAIGDLLAAKPRRIGWPHSFVPASAALEEAFYPTAQSVIDAAMCCLEEAR